MLTVPPESPSTVPLVHRWIANRAVRSAPALVVAAALFVWANAAIAYPGLDFPKIRSGMESDVRHVMSAVGPGLIWEPLTASYSYPPLAQCDDGPYYQAALEMQATFSAAGSSSLADRFRGYLLTLDYIVDVRPSGNEIEGARRGEHWGVHVIIYPAMGDGSRRVLLSGSTSCVKAKKTIPGNLPAS